ncbi:hypothetical protein FRC09_001464 [Ceratobasidium sp. 395]|nr:hypothetical protein FRC09_001464 [Ceratobasidium sp. 395]
MLTGYAGSAKSYRRLRESLGLFGVRKQGWTVETAAPVLAAARERHPTAGIQEMRNILRVENSSRVPRSVIHEWMKITEPDQLEARKRRVVKRRRFYSTGPNEIWALDQHDKWKRFGMWMHVGLDVYSGRILWLKVWKTNRNPRLICSWYLSAIEDPEIDGMPLLTYSDPGSENYGVANAQSWLRQMLDASLVGSMQHKWLRKHGNIKPEIFWSQLRARFAPPLEQLMQEGLDQEWYNLHNELEYLIFLWLFTPFLQSELDLFAYRYNTSRKRANTKTLLPQGRPKYIYEFPEHFDASNLKVSAPADLLEQARQRYADPHDPVFQLVPRDISDRALEMFRAAGSPQPLRNNVWDIYHLLLNQFRHLALPDDLRRVLDPGINLPETSQEQSETVIDDIFLEGYVQEEGENDFMTGDFSGVEDDGEEDVGGGVFE